MRKTFLQKGHKLLIHLNVKLQGCEIDQKKFLTEVEIGQNILISVPNVDRGKRDPSNVMAIVTERVHNGYKLSDSQCLDKETVDKTSAMSLRNAVRSISVCGGQGFTKCGCSASGKLRCNTKRCACKKAAVLCNSRCHPNIACNNK